MTAKTVEDPFLAADLRSMGAVSMADALDAEETHEYVEMARRWLRNVVDPAPAATQ